jgi:hypothetical protein
MNSETRAPRPHLWTALPAWTAILLSAVSVVISTLAYRTSTTASRLSQRAYVSHEIELYNRQDLIANVANDSDELTLFFGFKVTNFGNTPAKNLHYSFDYEVPALTRMFVGEGTSIRRLDIAPKQSRTLEVTLRFTNTAHRNTADHFFRTSLRGSMSYDDVFGSTETIPICYVMLANPTDARISACPQPIEVKSGSN